jgi:hypothetical protein
VPPSVNARLLNRLFGLNEQEIFRGEQVLDIRWKQHRFDLGPSFQWLLTPHSQDDWDLELSVPTSQVISPVRLFLLQAAVRAPLNQEIAFEYPVELRSGRGLSAAFRWDEPRKRFRAGARLPFVTSSADAVKFTLDLRDEEWIERLSGTSFQLETQQVSAVYERLFTGRKSLSFHGGYEHQRLDFDDERRNPDDDPHYLKIGIEWNQLVGLTLGDSLRLRWGARLETLRGFGGKKTRASQITSRLGLDWDLAESSRSALSVALGVGLASENLPLNQYPVTGVGQDDPLLLRAHPTVDEGRKGNSPMGRHHLLLNLELRRRLLRWKLIELGGLIFCDTGIIAGSPFVDPARRYYQDLGFGLRFGALGQEWIETLFGFDLQASSFNFWIGIPLNKRPG